MLKAWIGTLATPGQTRAVAWLLRLGCLAAVAAGGLAAAWAAGRPDLPGWATLALFVGLLCAGLVAGEGLYAAARTADQHRRDLGAADIMNAIRTGRDPGRFILYLRPFASTDAMADHAIRAIPVGRSGLVIDEDRLEIEGEIEAVLRGTAPLIALGKPLEHHGAGRIAVDETEWQSAVDALMAAASLIVLLPSPRTGTLWEIDRLIEGGHLARTLILDPPNHGSSRADYDPEAEWRAVQTAFAQRGLALPDDSRSGLVLHFAGGRPGAQQTPLGLDAARSLGAIVRQRLAAGHAGGSSEGE